MELVTIPTVSIFHSRTDSMVRASAISISLTGQDEVQGLGSGLYSLGFRA